MPTWAAAPGRAGVEVHLDSTHRLQAVQPSAQQGRSLCRERHFRAAPAILLCLFVSD